MFNERSRLCVDAARFGPHFRRPTYDSYNFAHLPASLPWLLTGRGRPALPADAFGPHAGPVGHVALCFIDAFGWQHVERALARSRFLRHAAEQGVLSKMTAMFPSTTAAHVTAVHTGQAPAASGVYAWQYFDPAVGTLIEPLPFALHRQPRESLRLAAVDPAAIFPGPSIYAGLAELGVRSFVLQPAEIAGSTCNQVYNAGAEARPYKSLAAALVGLRDILLNEPPPTYTFLYWDRIDSLAHQFGADSEAVDAEVDLVWLAFDHLLHDRLAPARRALVLVTADHGHMRTGDRPVLVNRDLPELLPLMQRDRLGRPLGPAGSRRDLFLHVQPEHVDAAVARLREALAGRAEAYPTAELIAQGFFGPTPASDRLLARVGSVAVLPYAGESVWWDEGPSGEKVSSHGGLTPEEMDIPLFVAPYG